MPIDWHKPCCCKHFFRFLHSRSWSSSISLAATLTKFVLCERAEVLRTSSFINYLPVNTDAPWCFCFNKLDITMMTFSFCCFSQCALNGLKWMKSHARCESTHNSVIKMQFLSGCCKNNRDGEQIWSRCFDSANFTSLSLHFAFNIKIYAFMFYVEKFLFMIIVCCSILCIHDNQLSNFSKLTLSVNQQYICQTRLCTFWQQNACRLLILKFNLIIQKRKPLKHAWVDGRMWKCDCQFLNGVHRSEGSQSQSSCCLDCVEQISTRI